jgi:hypothetical protein
MRTLTHADDPDIPEGITLEFLSDTPNLHAVDVIFESVEKMIIDRRARASLQLESIEQEAG